MIAEPRKGGTEPGLSAGFPYFSWLVIGGTSICDGRDSTEAVQKRKGTFQAWGNGSR